ncbi:MAG: polysaccharide biosynthesis/export family protein [Minicystis sp.]
MKTRSLRRRLLPLPGVLLACALSLSLSVLGCTAGRPHPLSLPPPTDATTLGVGDVFEMRIVGEEKLPSTFVIAPDGSTDLPYVKRLHVAGLEPQELSAAIRARLIEREIFSDPGVSVNIKEYNSKRIEVLGEVQKPGSLLIQPGMTLLRAISLSGGFNSIADKSRVTVRRRVQGGTKAASVSVQDIIENKIPDPPLQAGDSINVEQRFM